MNITDSHCHLDETRFDTDREAVIQRALGAGVTRLVTVGTDIESDKQAMILAEQYPQIYAVIGIHPNESGEANEADFHILAEMARHPKVVAIGETGLDFYRDYTPREKQRTSFRQHLDLASKLELPVVIHTRQSTPETIEILAPWVKQNTLLSPGVIHCFSEDGQVARQYLSLGFYLSFGGYIGYPRSRSPEVVKQVPLDRLLVETDAPFLPPQPYRGQRNEPVYITYTVEVMAQILGKTPGEIAEITTFNAKALFKIT